MVKRCAGCGGRPRRLVTCLKCFQRFGPGCPMVCTPGYRHVADPVRPKCCYEDIGTLAGQLTPSGEGVCRWCLTACSRRDWKEWSNQGDRNIWTTLSSSASDNLNWLGRFEWRTDPNSGWEWWFDAEDANKWTTLTGSAREASMWSAQAQWPPGSDVVSGSRQPSLSCSDDLECRRRKSSTSHSSSISGFKNFRVWDKQERRTNEISDHWSWCSWWNA